MVPDWAWSLLLLCISPAVGSFLGVLVDRLPAGASLVSPSRCASCATRLGPRDMIPLLSGLGRCRHCGAPVPGHLVRIEAAAFAAAIVVVLRVPDPVAMALLAIALWCLIALFYTDLLHYLLPDPIVLALLCTAIALSAWDPARNSGDAVLGAAAGAGAFWIIRWAYGALRDTEGLGLGDVKLMGAIGALLGWQALPYVTLVAGTLALAVVAIDAVRTRRLPERTARLPFGAYLSAAAATLLVFG